MLSFKYLRGVYFERMEGIPGIYLIPDGRDRKNFRLIGSYFDGKTLQFQIIRKLKEMNKEEGNYLQLHHIIEPIHFAEIDFMGQLSKWIKYELPCVFLSRKEHLFINHYLHISPEDEKFRDIPSTDWIKKSNATAEKAKDAGFHGALLMDWEKIQSLYQAAYEGDQYLQKIARNVLEEAKKWLPKHE